MNAYMAKKDARKRLEQAGATVIRVDGASGAVGLVIYATVDPSSIPTVGPVFANWLARIKHDIGKSYILQIRFGAKRAR
jgi:hypothetical protein